MVNECTLIVMCYHCSDQQPRQLLEPQAVSLSTTELIKALITRCGAMR